MLISKLDDGSEEFGSHYDSYTRQRIVTSIRTNKLRTHFLVYNYNPLKIVTAMVIIVKKLIKRFPTLKVSEDSILKNYQQFCNKLMIQYKDIDQVRDLLHDKMYNGKLVIDEMADYEMYQMFVYRKPLVICLEMWSGRYEQESFLSSSTAYQSIMNIFFVKKSFIGYYTNLGAEIRELAS